MKKCIKIGVIAGLAALTIAMVMHWGFFGLIVFTIMYGLWAENTPERNKSNN